MIGISRVGIGLQQQKQGDVLPPVTEDVTNGGETVTNGGQTVTNTS